MHGVPQFRRQGDGSVLLATVIAVETRSWSLALMATPEGLGRVPAVVGILLDDDRVPDPRRCQNVAKSVAAVTNATGWSLNSPAEPGTAKQVGSTRLGFFVLPDNQAEGTLESVLPEAGRVASGRLLDQAEGFVIHFDTDGLTQDDLEAGCKPSGRRKQEVAVATAILKPSRTVAVSLQDNRWIKEGALRTPLFAGFRGWIRQLLDLPAPVT